MQANEFIFNQTQIPNSKINATLKLLSEGATIPFIARYRKEATGSLDEVEIGKIADQNEKYLEIDKRKETILKSIEEQGKLDVKIKQKIKNCYVLSQLEDLYLPFKKKRKTKATVAIENGLEPLANLIWQQQNGSISKAAQSYLNSNIKSADDAIEGAKHIIAEWISQEDTARNVVRSAFKRDAILSAKVIKTKKDEAGKFADYFDYSIPLKKCPSHTYLAIRRGEKEGFLRVNLEPDNEHTVFQLIRRLTKQQRSESQNLMEEAVNDSYKRLLFPSIGNEFKKLAQEKADEEAIDVFVSNLKQLLLSAPVGSKTTLAIDPGFRTGCKVVVLSKNADLLEDTVIYPHPPQSRSTESLHTLENLIHKYKVEAIAVGNGTAGKETFKLCEQLQAQNVEKYMVNEAGASIYSASEVAREEFPDLDLTVRGAVSIGRRLMDPLAELVKVPAKSIGVGQYQHDVDQTKLKNSLDRAVESCVNQVGINLNTASKHLLTYVSGLGPTLAQNIVDYRSESGNFKNRKELLKVPRMGKKAYEQAAGFLRIRGGNNILDNTGIHPESYQTVQQIVTSQRTSTEELIGNKSLIDTINIRQFVDENIGLPTLKDIVDELKKPGFDTRGKAKSFQFAKGINTMEDLNMGVIVPGIVTNITKFGAFVDIGVKQDGLVHVSQIANQFVSDPHEFLKLNQQVQVKVVSIDIEKSRIGLSIKQAT